MIEALIKSPYTIHISNLILLIGFCFKDVLKLRILAFVACLIIIPYYLFLETPLFSAIAWTAVYASVHLFHIVRIVLERRPIVLSDRDEKIYQLVFSGIPRRKFFHLASLAARKKWEAGEKIISSGAEVSDLMIICSGRVQVMDEGNRVGELAEGQMIGTMGIILGEPQVADFYAGDSVSCIVWQLDEVRAWLEKNPDAVAACKNAVNQDLASKLKTLLPQNIKRLRSVINQSNSDKILA